MNERIALVAFLVGLALLSACAIQGSPFHKTAVPPGDSVIYVYRPYHYGSSMLRPPVICGDDMARIGPGGYHAFIIPAGMQTDCSVRWTETSDEVAIDGNKRVYYLREEIGWGVRSGHPHLDPVDADEGNRDIQQCCVQEQSGP
jgi:hypothetical protein